MPSSSAPLRRLRRPLLLRAAFSAVLLGSAATLALAAGPSESPAPLPPSPLVPALSLDPLHNLAISPLTTANNTESSSLDPSFDVLSGRLQPEIGAASSAADPAFTLPPAPLRPVESSVTVSASSSEISAAQIQLAEKQRVLGVVPNFYASYIWDAAPLSPRQKFSLALRFSTDPVAVAMTAAVAGSEQAQHTLPGYGFGAAGYGKRFGATYADGFNSTLLGQAVLPTILRQDPRYFVKPGGSIAAQAMYALANTILCRGDNGRWQVNYSNIGGNFAAAGLSNLYYPATSRRGPSLTINTALLTTASGALGNLMQQFVLRRMTPHVPDYDAVSAR